MASGLSAGQCCLLLMSAAVLFPMRADASDGGLQQASDVTRTHPADRRSLKSALRNATNSSSGASLSSSISSHPPGGGVGCRALRSKRYLSDGFCRSLRPISEVLCTGRCVTGRDASIAPGVVELWDRTSGGRAFEWRCVDGDVRYQRKKLVCDNGDVRVYRIRVVKSCACSRTPKSRGHDPYRQLQQQPQPQKRRHQQPEGSRRHQADATDGVDATRPIDD